MKSALQRIKDRIEAWLWERHPDAFDKHLEWRSTTLQRLRNARCWLIGHEIQYMPPGPWDWDGEYTPYCNRCDPDGHPAAADACEITFPLFLQDLYWDIRWKLGLVKSDA